MISPLRQAGMLVRGQGCILGQVAEDSLGSLVEFRSQEEIRREYPKGVRELADGGTWNTIAGQPTDDSEMALSPARMLADQGRYNPDESVHLLAGLRALRLRNDRRRWSAGSFQSGQPGQRRNDEDQPAGHLRSQP